MIKKYLSYLGNYPYSRSLIESSIDVYFGQMSMGICGSHNTVPLSSLAMGLGWGGQVID